MSQGKRYKFQGSTIAVMVGFSGASPLPAITGISKANPAVVTATNTLAAGDVVFIDNVAGMTEVNGGLYVVLDPSGSNFKLAGVDSTGYTAWSSGGTFDKATFSQFCELTNYNRQGGSKTEQDATSLCSDAVEVELGLRDFGTTELSFNFAPRTTVQGALAAYDESGDKIAVKVELPNSGGKMVQLGFVQKQSEQAGTGGLWTASATIRNTGARVDISA